MRLGRTAWIPPRVYSMGWHSQYPIPNQGGWYLPTQDQVVREISVHSTYGRFLVLLRLTLQPVSLIIIKVEQGSCKQALVTFINCRAVSIIAIINPPFFFQILCAISVAAEAKNCCTPWATDLWRHVYQR